MTGLKPCPFCGGHNLDTYSFKNFAKEVIGVYVWCTDCYGKGGIGNTEEEAVLNWNRRPNCDAWEGK